MTKTMPPPPKPTAKRKRRPTAHKPVERVEVWDGNNLYVRYGKRRWYLGTIVRRAFAPIWSVWIRGGQQIDVNSEEAARQRLEDYARDEARWPRLL